MSNGQMIATVVGIFLGLETIVMGLVMWIYGYRVPLHRVALALVLTWVPVILLGWWFGPRFSLLLALFVARVIAMRVLCDVEWHEAFVMTRILGFVEGVALVALVVWAVMNVGNSGIRIIPFL